jgi:cysteine desulfurase
MKRIYLDNNATTPVRKEVKDAVIPFLTENFGNPSSLHKEGRIVKTAIENARENIAKLLNADVKEIVFNSCATEGNNSVLKGYLANFKNRDKTHIITTSVEHPCVINSAKFLKKKGFDVTFLPVDSKGRLDLNLLEKSISKKTGLISIMMVNNETGNIYPVEKIGEIAKKHNVLFHVDAAQSAGKIEVDVKKIGVDFLTISGHKFYALKGAGALFIKKGRKLDKFMLGGHQERNLRSGTENVVGIIAMGEAAKLAKNEIDKDIKRIGELRDYFEKRILNEIPYTKVLGDIDSRIYTTSNITFKFVEGEAMLLKLDYSGISASTGSACSSLDLTASHVIMAMNVPVEESHSSLRFSLGKGTTKEELDFTVDKLKETVEQLRKFSPLYSDFLKSQKND